MSEKEFQDQQLENERQAYEASRYDDELKTANADLTALRSSLDAANRALAEARETIEKGVSDYLSRNICCSGDDCACGGATFLQQLVQEEAGSQLTEVRAKPEAAEKERDDLKLLHSNLVSAVNELWLQLENWGFIPCNDGWLGAVIKMHAQLTAAQAHVSRLQSDKPFTCFKCGTDDPQMMCPNCANSAAASREAALVEALKNSRVILEEGEPQQRHLDGPVPTKEEETRHSTYWIRHQVTVAQIDAALARCSPPAAETET